jgi:hypothetical protein
VNGSSSPLFQQACRAYFRAKLGKEIGRVEFEYDEGYEYSSYTYQDPAFRIRVYGADEPHYYLAEYTDTTAGEFLTELFHWEGDQTS